MPDVTITSFDSVHGIGTDWVGFNGTTGAAVWPAANRAIYIPIYLWEPGVVVKLFIANGTHSGNVDIGLYSESLVRLVSAGSTAMAGDSVLQIFDVTDTPVVPGRYYLGVACDTGATATFIRSVISVSAWRAMGVVQQASALPLPNPMVPASVASAYCPLAGLSYRVTL